MWKKICEWAGERDDWLGHVLLIVVTVAAVTCLTLFFSRNMVQSADGEASTDALFERVADGSRLALYREKATGVIYVVYAAHGKAGLTVMLDAQGKPLLYEKWLALRERKEGGR